MKLWNVLSVAALGTLFVVGCSSTTTTTSDSGTGSDTGAKTDTGSSGDTGAATDSGTKDTGTAVTCEQCQKDAQAGACKAQASACAASDATLKGCQDLFTCMNACSDAACQNACISSSTSTEGKDLLNCIITQCVGDPPSGPCAG